MKKLLELKSILSLLFATTTCYLGVTGKIGMDAFMGVTSAIVTYYFTRAKQE